MTKIYEQFDHILYELHYQVFCHIILEIKFNSFYGRVSLALVTPLFFDEVKIRHLEEDRYLDDSCHPIAPPIEETEIYSNLIRSLSVELHNAAF